MPVSQTLVTYGAGDATLITTGMLPMVMLVSTILTAPISLALLHWYRRAVLRAMAGNAGVAPPFEWSAGRKPPSAV